MIKFQFHTGSIKSQYQHSDQSDSRQSFNSILVRLKAHNAYAYVFYGGFNSILVRLKVVFVKYSPWIASAFQFHTGSIKSHLNYSQVSAFSEFQFHTGSIKSHRKHQQHLQQPVGFNSILVRLKVDSLSEMLDYVDRFNSILVRLKADYLFPRAWPQGRFNSILVRLKASPLLNMTRMS